MGTLPFLLFSDLPAGAGEYLLTLNLHPEESPEPDPLTGEPYTMDPSDEMVSLFAKCAAGGMFRPQPGLRRSRFDLLRGGKGAPGAVWHYEFAVTAVPPEAYAVLLALLAQASYNGDPLAKVELVCDPAGPLLHRDTYLRQERRIRRTDGPAPFAVEIDPAVLDSESFIIRVEHAGPVAPDLKEVLEGRLAAWDETRVLGGFLFDFQKQEATGNFSSIALAERNVMQVWVNDFYEGDASGLEMLVNLAIDAHEHHQPVRRLVIE